MKKSFITARLLVFLSIALSTFGCAAPSPDVAPPKTGREVVARMIEAHGGLGKWQSAPTVSFEDAFLPAGASSARVSRVTVEQGARRAYLEFPKTGARISWDGEQAWSENWQGRLPPRFVALLSYYFMNLPWLAADPGVKLSEPGTGRLWDDPTEYITVKMSFEPGVGDTPDDYYILYLDPTSYRLRGTEFIVTYAAVLPPEVEAVTEILLYEEFATVDGLTVPAKASVYHNDRSPLAAIEWREWSFSKPFDESRMVMPSAAVVDTSTPARRAETPQ